MTIFQSVFLSVIQGLTEFLPVSSSGHLIIFPAFFNWPDQGLAFDAMIHIGTALAALIYFRADVLRMIKSVRGGDKKALRLVGVILVSMIPAAIVAFLFKEVISSTFRTTTFVAMNLTIWAVVLIAAELFARGKRKTSGMYDISYVKGFLIGIAQALALFPGTSRSGITISAALFSKTDRKSAVSFSFLMGIPVILGVGILSLIELVSGNGSESVSASMIIVSLLFSFGSGLIAIHLLLKFIQKGALIYFGIYRIILAGAIFLL